MEPTWVNKKKNEDEPSYKEAKEQIEEEKNPQGPRQLSQINPPLNENRPTRMSKSEYTKTQVDMEDVSRSTTDRGLKTAADWATNQTKKATGKEVTMGSYNGIPAKTKKIPNTNPWVK